MNKNPESSVYSWYKTFAASAVIFCIMLLLLGLFHQGNRVYISYAIVLSSLIVMRKKKFLTAFAVSTFLGFIWVYMAKSFYLYDSGAAVILGINIFTLSAFAIGLLGVYIIYWQFQQRLSYKLFSQKVILYSSIYWVMLIAFEWIGYHKFNIRNGATSVYPGLVMVDCLHAPKIMKAAYLSFGPLFFLINTGADNKFKDYF
ncbi:MAG: hypothetical protein PF545_01305 [Elusimicrobia bacterium]|jgi:hypothetical protein|nr:hypothetical protein [Elusimicrobiota bacterium]